MNTTKNTSLITKKQVKHLAKLAHLQISDQESEELTSALEETLSTVKQLITVDTKDIEPTSQVTGLENIFREDKVDVKRMFTQKEALSQANKTAKGYFVVPKVIPS